MESFPIPAPAFSGNSRVVPPGNAFDWLRQGWALFVANPGLWIALTIVLVVILFGLQIVPVIGTLAAHLLMPVLGAGMLLVCKKIDDGGSAQIDDLFAGFKQNTGPLVMVGVLYMAAMLAIFVLALVIGGGSLAGGLLSAQPAGIGVAFGGLLLSLLLSLALSVPVFMAVWFAPALVFFNNMQPAAALRASFDACMKNVLAFFVYGLIVMVLMFFAALPVFLGFLVLIPVLAGSVYAAYRDVFVAN
ncbi:MAG: BPSS1780 family membrane protein [Propionivibrio sp.]